MMHNLWVWYFQNPKQLKTLILKLNTVCVKLDKLERPFWEYPPQ